MGIKNSLLEKLLGSASNFSDEQVVQTVDMLLQNAVGRGATDVHLEPHDRFVLVRYRIGGIMHCVHKLPIATLPAISRQIKKLAHLSTNEMRTWQEGKFSLLVDEETYDIRATIVPVLGGEKTVLHLSHKLSKPLTLEEVGFWGHALRDIRVALSRPRGLILLSASKHSGKSTTMQSLVSLLNTPSLSIVTIEDSAEQRLIGVTQNRVHPRSGQTYNEELEGALSQDANIIAINSLPDRATTDTAVRAASSGHLIIGGLHSENASAAIAHARALSEESYLFASALHLSISQRLVRRLCDRCKEQFALSAVQVSELEAAFGISSPAARRRVHELERHAILEHVGNSKTSGSTPSHITHLWKPNDDGCKACHFTGYSGQIAICEVLGANDDIRGAVLAHAPASKIHEIGLKHGMVPMGLDGLIKSLRGQTTIEEILRVIDVRV